MPGYHAGGPYSDQFALSNPSTGAAYDADVLPVASATRNGVIDPGFVPVVSHVSLGLYNVVGTIPSGYAVGDAVAVSVSAVVGGTAVVEVLETFVVAPLEPESVITAIPADIVTLAFSRPRRVQGDAGEVEQHSLSELIQADKYLTGKTAAAQSGRGIRFTRLIPDGTVNR